MEGPLVVDELLGSRLEVQTMFVEAGRNDLEDLVRRAEERGARVAEVPARTIELLADTATPQGVVAVAGAPAAGLDTLIGTSIALVLADVRDPGNAGTLIRTALAAGVDAVVAAKGTADPLHPKTVRSSAGALFHIPVVRGVDALEALAAARAAGLRIVGTDAAAGRPYDEADLMSPVAVVLGNEAWGAPESVRDHLDEVVSIPMPGPAESLNVSIAGALVMFEAVRQRRRG